MLPEGVTPFHISVGLDDPELSEEMTRMMLKHGANPDVRYVLKLFLYVYTLFSISETIYDH